MKKLIIFIQLLFVSVTVAQTEKEGFDYLYAKQYDKAQEALQKVLTKTPGSIPALYGLGRLHYDKQQNLKKSQDKATFKYRNFQAHFDLLEEGYRYATQAVDAYEKLSPEARERLNFKQFALTEAEVRTNFPTSIEKEAYTLLLMAPYKNSYESLYSSAIYSRELDADTLTALRDALFNQCTRFLEVYTKSPDAASVYRIRKDLLAEYISIQSMRRYGDRSGKMYERYCDLISKHFTAEELKHVLPQFYGMEYGWGIDYQKEPSFLKLQQLAEQEKTDVMGLLCRLSLHDRGCTDANRVLYDRFIRQMAPSDVAYVAVQKMAVPHVVQKNWSEVSRIYKNYKSLFPAEAARFDRLISMVEAADDNIKLVNLGTGVNTALGEYSPVLSADGNTLYFARRNDNTGEDIFTSTLKNGKWETAQPIAGNINTRSHEIPLSSSIDGNTLVIFGNYSGLPDYYYVLKKEKKLGKGDIYFVKKNALNYDKVEVFPYPVNSENYEADLSITADERAVLFCSDRKGAVGGHKPNYPPESLYYHGSGEFNTDIWVSVKDDKGAWGNPINLGSTINTPFAEKKPFLHPDMRTLYFCSEGHYGLGGYDIFMSKRLREDSWTEWSEPVNLGKVINSPTDDSFYINTTGETAFVVSNKPGNNFGKNDIYSIAVPERFRPEPVTIVSGKVTDDNGNPVFTQVTWEESGEPTAGGSGKGSTPTSPTPKRRGEIETSAKDGSFYFTVPTGRKYVYYAEKKGYFGGSLNLDVTETTTSKRADEKTIELNSLDKTNKNRKPFVMKNLNFDHDSDVIRPESFFDLKRLAVILKQNPGLKLLIEGHTDHVGDDAFNLDLSQRRANAVLEYLVKEGANRQNLMAKGFGETKFVADNKTEGGKEKNRRVEFKVLEQ